jgi:hypothetical protein
VNEPTIYDVYLRSSVRLKNCLRNFGFHFVQVPIDLSHPDQVMFVLDKFKQTPAVELASRGWLDMVTAKTKRPHLKISVPNNFGRHSSKELFQILTQSLGLEEDYLKNFIRPPTKRGRRSKENSFLPPKLRTFKIALSIEEVEMLLEYCEPTIQMEKDSAENFAEEKEMFLERVKLWERIKGDLQFILELQKYKKRTPEKQKA